MLPLLDVPLAIFLLGTRRSERQAELKAREAASAAEQKAQYIRMAVENRRRDTAAWVIQKAWRGYWSIRALVR